MYLNCVERQPDLDSLDMQDKKTNRNSYPRDFNVVQ
jgi:hypothetical protein